MSSELPTFERPPLHETWLGIQFDPLPKLTAAHLGGFICQLGEDWSPAPDVQAIGQILEPVDVTGGWSPVGLRLEMTTSPRVRLRATSPRGDRMIQLENGWIVYNWRQLEAGGDYPRYARLKHEFDEQLRSWRAFLASREVGEFRPNLWEVSYANFIDKGTAWNRIEDVQALLPMLLGSMNPAAAGQLQTLGGQWSFVIAPGEGRMQITLEHRARSSEGKQESILLRLVARGPIDPDREDSLERGFELGHRAIIRTFPQLVSSKALDYWGHKP